LQRFEDASENRPIPELDRGAPTVEFDVFLSHNSKDKPAVRELARLLEEQGIRNDLGFRLCRASHISTGLLMAARAWRGPRARRVARPGRASKIMTRPRLGIEP
jgi:hypothetical protein